MKHISRSGLKLYQWISYLALTRHIPWLCRISLKDVSIGQVTLKYLLCTLSNKDHTTPIMETKIQDKYLTRTSTGYEIKTQIETTKEKRIPTFYALPAKEHDIQRSSTTKSLIIMLDIYCTD